jgi:hypothetical protein
MSVNASFLIDAHPELIDPHVPKERGKRDSVNAAKVGKLDNINSPLTRLDL